MLIDEYIFTVVAAAIAVVPNELRKLHYIPSLWLMSESISMAVVVVIIV